MSNKKQVKKAPAKVKPIANAVNTTQSDAKMCFLCGKPATIMAPSNRFYCCLACQTNNGD